MTDFIKQINLWNQNEEYQKIIDTLEALPENEQTPELLFLLAHAYYCLNREGEALPLFEKAQKARCKEKSIKQYIEECVSRITYPGHLKPFRTRTNEAWAAFVASEARLRDLMDRAKLEDTGRELIAECSQILSVAFDAPAFELGFDGKKYNLILTPEGNRVRLFQLVYFAGHAPKHILEHWNIIVGRTRSDNYMMRMHGLEIAAADFRVRVEPHNNKDLVLSLYCEKILPLLKANENNAYSLAYILLDQVLGEIVSMRYVDNIRLLPAPMEESFPLTDLPSYIETKVDPDGWSDSNDPAAACERYIGYQNTPSAEETWPLRADVFAGITCCLPPINAYFNGDDYYMNLLHRNGAVPGFLYWPLEGIEKDDILSLRDQIEAAVLEKAGTDAVTFTGGATGQTYGYLDFIAWDFPAVMSAAKEALDAAPLRQAFFHTFRMNAYSVGLKQQESEKNNG